MFILILVVMGILIIIEKKYPAHKLPIVSNWYPWTLSLNLIQLIVAVLGHYFYVENFNGFSLVKLNIGSNPYINGFVGYIIMTWVFYWWHLLRHQIDFLWLIFHQVHHSPTRMEILTSFYKHPLEVIFNSIIMIILLNPILGMDAKAGVYTSIFTAVGEFWYHLNIKTPHWIGYFIQRPESHRLHHLQNTRICKNYTDLPIWDILNRTFENPVNEFHPIGFNNGIETNVMSMMMFNDVRKNRSVWNTFSSKDVLLCLLLLLGCLHTIGYVGNSATVKGFAFTTVASPLPLVFSIYNGIETFSTEFDIEAVLLNDTLVKIHIDNKIYGRLQGPYNRRNVYGAIFSHGPFFNTESLVKIRQSILTHGLCGNKYHWQLRGPIKYLFGFATPRILLSGLDRPLIRELGFDSFVQKVNITIKSKTAGNENKTWTMSVVC